MNETSAGINLTNKQLLIGCVAILILLPVLFGLSIIIISNMNPTHELPTKVVKALPRAILTSPMIIPLDEKEAERNHWFHTVAKVYTDVMDVKFSQEKMIVLFHPDATDYHVTNTPTYVCNMLDSSNFPYDSIIILYPHSKTGRRIRTHGDLNTFLKIGEIYYNDKYDTTKHVLC